jgi:hypothetical protein
MDALRVKGATRCCQREEQVVVTHRDGSLQWKDRPVAQEYLEGVWKGGQGVLAAKRASIRRLMAVYTMASLVSGKYS